MKVQPKQHVYCCLYKSRGNVSKESHYKSNQTVKKHNIIASNIRKVLVDHKDDIWIGTRAGLYRINKNEEDSFSITSFNEST